MGFQGNDRGHVESLHGQNISAAASKYLQFAIGLVGISGGTRVHLLEEYIGAPSYNKEALAAAITQEVWVMAVYHTLASLEGIAWLFIALAFLFPMAIVTFRKFDMTRLLAGRGTG